MRNAKVAAVLLSFGLIGCEEGPSLQLTKTTNISAKVAGICSHTRRVFVDDVSEDGTNVVGVCGKRNAPNDRHAFLYSESTGARIVDIVPGWMINQIRVSGDGSVIWASVYFKDRGTRLFRHTASTGVQDLGAFGVEGISVHAVSSEGSVIVGHFRKSSTQYPMIYHAYRYSEAHGFENLGVLSTESTHARGVSASGAWITGNIDIGTSGKQAVRYIRTHAFRYSRSTGIEEIDVAKSGEDIFPSAITDDGRIFVGVASFRIGFIVSFYEKSYLFIHTARQGMQKLAAKSMHAPSIMRLSGDGTMATGSFS